IYPKAKYQHCCVHVSRNIAHKVRVKDRKEICDDFKAVYQASSKEEANTFLGSGMATVFLTNFIRCRTSFRMLFRLSL
ncbi:transposase, partial [Enterococcus faecium]|nr:transposase [Enterococcus faecium]